VCFPELEYSYFKEGFQHLIPIMQTDNHEGLAVLSLSLLEAKNDLALLNNIFPIMNRQVINNDLLPALEQIEAPVQTILAAMECRGIAFDSSRVEKVQSQLEKRVKKLELLSREITKDPDFLLSSPQQVSNFLFDVLKLSPPAGLVSKTKAGSSHRSTSEETLKAIKAEMISRDGSAHSILDVILEFRTLNKMLTTYILPLPSFCYREKANDEFPRIHPHWVQTVC
jgi:DNA polymerase-1